MTVEKKKALLPKKSPKKVPAIKPGTKPAKKPAKGYMDKEQAEKFGFY